MLNIKVSWWRSSERNIQSKCLFEIPGYLDQFYNNQVSVHVVERWPEKEEYLEIYAPDFKQVRETAMAIQEYMWVVHRVRAEIYVKSGVNAPWERLDIWATRIEEELNHRTVAMREAIRMLRDTREWFGTRVLSQVRRRLQNFWLPKEEAIAGR